MNFINQNPASLSSWITFVFQGKPAEESKSKSAIAIDDCQFHQCVFSYLSN